MKRALRVLGWSVLVLLVGVILTLNFFAGSVITGSVRAIGPQVLKVPVGIDGASARLLRGKVGIKGLVIGNPEGFKTDFAFKLGEFNLAMSVPSIFTDHIRIDEVIIDDPEISYELSLHGSNLGALMKALEPAEGTSEAQPAATEAKGTQKKVEIGLVRVTNAKIKLSGTALQGKALTIPLPTIELKDIGKESGGTSVANAVSRVLKAVVTSTGAAVGSAVGSVGAGAEAVGDVAVQGAEAIAGGATAAGEAVAEGAKAAGEAVGKTAGKLFSGATSLFKKGEEKAQGDQEPTPAEK